jgi:hypothetical protein
MTKRLQPMIHRTPLSHRSPHPRRGSVLILVVALLVLMALIGTAWISTARVDRGSTIQHASSAQIDLLVEGEVQKVQGALIRDIKPSEFRSAGGGYRHSDDLKMDRFLAARVPQFIEEVARPWTATVPSQVGIGQPARYTRGAMVSDGGRFWVCKQSHNASQVGQPSNGQYWAEAPALDWGTPGSTPQAVVWSAISHLSDDTVFEDLQGGVPEFGERLVMRPLQVEMPPGSGILHPALNFYHPRAGLDGNGAFVTVIAGDADGDGIADGPLSRIKVGRLNGLDYFATVRVVDEGSAVNLNAAWFPEAATAQNWLPSNLHLVQLQTTDPANNKPIPLVAGLPVSRDPELHLISWQRFAMQGLPSNPAAEPGYQVGASVPLNDQPPGTQMQDRRRGDVLYRSEQEMLWNVLGKRIDNPGYWEDNAGNPQRARGFSASDMFTLRYKGGSLLNPDGIVQDPTTPSNWLSSSLIESVMRYTLFESGSNHPSAERDNMYKKGAYPPGNIYQWFRDNYDYLQLIEPEDNALLFSWKNRRPLLTTRNGVSNAAPSRQPIKVWTPSEVFRFGDKVIYDVTQAGNDNNIVGRVQYVCVDPIRANANTGSAFRPGQPAAGEVPLRTGWEVAGPPAARSTDQVRSAPIWAQSPATHYPTRASVNTADFAQLWMAYWNVMVQDQTTTVNAAQSPISPFSYAFHYHRLNARNIGLPADYFNNPYVGSRFVPGDLLNPAFPVVPFDRYIEPVTNSVEQNPLRMFKSPLRGVSGDGTYDGTYHVLPESVVQLRAALAAVNTMDMRDGDDDVTAREFYVHGYAAPLPDNLSDLTPVPMQVRVYGTEAQPYLTEVYVNTDTENEYPLDRGTANPTGRNQAGYVAIELHNPYPFAIDISQCKIATIDRWPTGLAGADVPPPSGGRARYPNMSVYDHNGRAPAGGVTPVSDVIDLSALPGGTHTPVVSNLVDDPNSPPGRLPGRTQMHDPLVIPPNGYLVLENVRTNPAATPGPRGTKDATARPPGAMSHPDLMTTLGGRVIAPATTNFAFVPNLDLVLNKEFVLLRPLYGRRVHGTGTVVVGGAWATADNPVLQYYSPANLGVDPAIEMVPLDSFDFTGIANPDPDQPLPHPTRAYAWHYTRASNPAGGKAWKFVYPGRYDAGQTNTPPVAGSETRLPRHQGVREASMLAPRSAPNDAMPLPGWNHQGQGENEPWGIQGDATHPPPAWGNPVPGISLGMGSGTGLELNSSYPRAFTIQVASNGMPGPHPVATDTGNIAPFGGFARNGDILQVPFIGAYRVRIDGQPPTSVLELNAITMDSVFAEDTDPYNDPAANNAVKETPDDPRTEEPEPGHLNYGSTYVASTADVARLVYREQLGRFVPTLADLGIGSEPMTVPANKPNSVSGVAVTGTISTLVDQRGRQESVANYWAGYDIEITNGRGKGQVRTVVEYRNGELTVFPGWESQASIPDATSEYVLRRGSYRWTTDLFDYLCVDSPQDDFLPNRDAATYGITMKGDPSSSPQVGLFIPVAGQLLPPQAINNTSPSMPPAVTYGRVGSGSAGTTRFSGTLNLSNISGHYGGTIVTFLEGPAAGSYSKVSGYDGPNRELHLMQDLSSPPNAGDLFKIIGPSEDTTATHGLININTAPWPVLATLPMTLDPGDNIALAKAIVGYRDGDKTAGTVGNGPFQSIYDLMKVPEFTFANLSAMEVDATRPQGPAAAHGDFTPGDLDRDGTYDAATENDNVRYDFEEQFLILNRISNLITTRSDTFTCYVLVQGWRGAGTANPELVVQRRRAFITDRSEVTPTTGEMPLQYFYNE